ncbi:Ficolin-1 [Holothuria leucospilota]|uniref:Ficolin-1 n=1 Tax=Holothuria leucospilota TaxID=206669 RepID=A0A9Q1BVC0_HOLLE|nr:Ficolin-1 [Holothuria leucospilota]
MLIHTDVKVNNCHILNSHAMPLVLQFSVVWLVFLCRIASIVSSQNSESSFFFYQQPEYPRDCKEARESCSTQSSSGVILIKPVGFPTPFEVFCDNEIDSGGWTVIQRRQDGGGITFQRNWIEYKDGFGFLSQEFFLGNEKLSFLTNQDTYQLRIDFTYASGVSYYALYNFFRISDEFSSFALTSVGQYSGTATFTTNQPDYIDCLDVYQAGKTDSGVYIIKPTTWDGPPFEVYCNMTDGGGWTVFQRRVNGSVSFDVDWDDYKDGFGSPDHELWLGNEKMFSLTTQRRYQLRIDFVNFYGEPYFAKYEFFRIANETYNYRLNVKNYTEGDAGDSLTSYHDNEDFSTRDQDNDDYSFYDCVNDYGYGAWWYGSDCYYYYYDSALNGDYDDGYIYWYTLPRDNYNIKYTEMKVRPV